MPFLLFVEDNLITFKKMIKDMTFIKNIASYTKETKKKFSEAITEFSNEDSNYFFNEKINKEKIFEMLNSKFS